MVADPANPVTSSTALHDANPIYKIVELIPRQNPSAEAYNMTASPADNVAFAAVLNHYNPMKTIDDLISGLFLPSEM